MSNREEFDKWVNSDIEQFHGELKWKDVDFQPIDVWQAATEAADAKWQEQLAAMEARIKDLEEWLGSVLRAHKSNNNGAYMGEATLCQYFETMAEHALSTTSPDQALQRAILEARIDELKFLDESRNYKISPEHDIANRIAGLLKQREELGG